MCVRAHMCVHVCVSFEEDDLLPFLTVHFTLSLLSPFGLCAPHSVAALRLDSAPLHSIAAALYLDCVPADTKLKGFFKDFFFTLHYGIYVNIFLIFLPDYKLALTPGSGM